LKAKNRPFLNADILKESVVHSFKMLNPACQYKNPVMFATYVGAIVVTVWVAGELFSGNASSFNIQIAIWLWFTVYFANFAESMAECRGKAQASSLKTHGDCKARLIVDGKESISSASRLKKGDVIICEAGELIAADGEAIEGVATVDESAITGESAPVIRESGGDRSAVTAGTKVLSDKLLIRVTSEPGHSFLDKMISLIEGAKRQKTPNEISLSIVLSGLTALFLTTVFSLKIFADYSANAAGQDLSAIVTVPVLVALFVCLIPTTISALLSAVGIAGMDRLICKNVIAKSGRSVEAAGDIDLLMLDKTGTITMGNRMAVSFIPAGGYSEEDFAKIAQIASLSDETPEGRSIVVLAKNRFGLRAETLEADSAEFIPFSARTRISGVDLPGKDGKAVRSIRKGAASVIRNLVEMKGGKYPLEIDTAIQMVSKEGGTPLVVADGDRIAGVVHLKDIVKGGIKERFAEMRRMGIKTLMITGDNPLTAAAIAAEAGVDDYVAEATPEIKLAIIKKEQAGGRLVAMTGDGTNDAPALAQADVGVAMNTGTQASREAGNMVDLDSNPTKLIDIVEIGKQLLMTRGALTTFSIANDIAKYFAIIPAIFGSLYAFENSYGPLFNLNIMHLHSPQSAILSAVIFNAVIIIGLIPLALKGVPCKAESADKLLKRNLFIYGLGGIIAPFIGIKLIDLVIEAIGAI